MNKRLIELQHRYSQLSDDNLIRIVKVDFREYENEAVNLAKKELEKRNIDVADINSNEILINDKKNRNILLIFKSRFSMLNYICISILLLLWLLFIMLMTYLQALHQINPKSIIELIILAVSITMFYIIISLFIESQYSLVTSISSIVYSLWIMNRWRYLVDAVSLNSVLIFWLVMPVISSIMNNLYASKYEGKKVLFYMSYIISIITGLGISFIGLIVIYLISLFILV
jgi:hypothetical protein